MGSRYDADGNEAQFEPGSDGQVLRNKLGIRRVDEMEEAESEALKSVQRWAVAHYDSRHRFTAGPGKRSYIAAIHAAVGGDYAPMQQRFATAIKQTLSAYGGSA